MSLTIESCLSRVNLSSYEKDFTFEFADNKSIQLPAFAAEIISKKVSEKRKGDILLNSMMFDLRISDESITKLNNFINGSNIVIENHDDLNDEIIRVLCAIGCVDIDKALTNVNITLDNAINIAIFKKDNHLSFKKEIDFIASNFEEFVHRKIPDDIIEDVLASQSLAVSSERTILDCIASRIETDKRNIRLIKYI